MALSSKQILITISTSFTKGGVDAAKAALNDLKKSASGVTGPLNQVQAAGGRLGSVFGRFGNAFKNVTSGFGGIGGAIKSILAPFNLFDSIFGRVTLGMLTWQAWRTVVDGFNAITDAIVGGNARMQVAQNTFTALAGGSKELGQTYVDLTRQIAGETGQNIDSLLANAKRLPTQVGQNFKAFTDLTKTALVLGMLDPIQGVEGAMLSLTNAMEGTSAGFRSLLMRFEIGTMEQIKRILEETNDPLEALNKLLEEAGINVDEFIKAQMNTLPVAFNGIINTAREFLRLLGEPAVAEFTKTIISLRDWLLENRAAVEGLARAIGDRLLVMFVTLKEFIRQSLFGGQDVTPEMLFGGLMTAITRFVEWLLSVIESILNILASLAEAIAGLFGGGGKAAAEMGGMIARGGKRPRPGTQPAAAEETAPELTGITEAISQVVTRPIEEIRAALLAVREGGKETIEQFVKGMVEGLTAADLEKLSQDILNSVLNLEAQELQQEKAIKNLEDWVDQAEKEVQSARDKLKLFDLATEDIPERFTRARRRQLELEVMSAEQEQRRRKEALELAREQLAATKEQLQAQRQVLQLIEQQLKAAEEEGGGGINKGFVAPDIDTEEFKKQVEEMRKKFAAELAPLFDRIEATFGRIVNAAGRLKVAVDEIVTGIKGFIGTVDTVLSSLGLGWENLDPGLRTVLLALVGLTVLKSVIPLVFALSFKLAGAALGAGLGAAGAATPKLVAWIMAALGGASLAALTLPAAIAILITMVWLGKPELVKWLTGERQLELAVVVFAKVTEGFNKLLEILGFDFQIDASGILQPIIEEIDRVKANAEQEGILDTIGSWFTGERQGRLAGQVGEAVKGAIWTPITQWAQDTYNEVVGQSIIPDMLTAIITEFTNFPGRIQEPLVMMRETIMAEMNLLRDDWISDWDEMAAAVERTMNLQEQAREASLKRTGKEAAKAANRAANQRQAQPVNLNLDAKETRKLMEEGVYNGLMEVIPGEGSA